jgi:hypothetical protein
MLPVVLERSRGLLRVRAVVVAAVTLLCKDLDLQHWLAPHLRGLPRQQQHQQQQQQQQQQQPDQLDEQPLPPLQQQQQPELAADRNQLAPAVVNSFGTWVAALASRTVLSLHRWRVSVAQQCVASLPEPARASLVLVVICSVVSLSVVLMCGVPVVIGHAVSGFLGNFVDDLSDVYKSAIGMYVARRPPTPMQVSLTDGFVYCGCGRLCLFLTPCYSYAVSSIAIAAKVRLVAALSGYPRLVR